jgi:plastocyanin domain-containing protein
MTLDKQLVIVGGIGLIGFIWWFFFGKKDDGVNAGKVVEIIVAGGYKPSVIKINKDQETTFLIKRTEANSCLEEIVFPEFKIKEYLPVNEIVTVKIKPTDKGEFKFHCGMNMYHGKVVAV